MIDSVLEGGNTMFEIDVAFRSDNAPAKKSVEEITTSSGVATRFNTSDMVKSASNDLYASLHLLKAKKKKSKKVDEAIKHLEEINKLLEEI